MNTELPAGTFRLEGYIEVPLERIAEVEAALGEHIALTRAEPGCIFFNVDPCPEVAGRFLVSEAFAGKDAFDAHQSRASASPWAKVSAGIPREYKTWQID